MLAQSVVHDFQGKARFVVENYGDSKLAAKFGVTQYPAIFVDDVLVATPKDFYNSDEKAVGRYIPFKTAEAHERFRSDLSRMIDLILEGRKDAARSAAAPARAVPVAQLPSATILDLDGRPIPAAELANRPVVVEVWATWCPPCRGSLVWLAKLRKQYGDRLAVVAIAVQSEEPAVRKIAADTAAPLAWSIGTP